MHGVGFVCAARTGTRARMLWGLLLAARRCFQRAARLPAVFVLGHFGRAFWPGVVLDTQSSFSSENAAKGDRNHGCLQSLSASCQKTHGNVYRSKSQAPGVEYCLRTGAASGGAWRGCRFLVAGRVDAEKAFMTLATWLCRRSCSAWCAGMLPPSRLAALLLWSVSKL